MAGLYTPEWVFQEPDWFSFIKPDTKVGLTWTTRDGRKIELHDLEVAHIQNIIKHFGDSPTKQQTNTIKVLQDELKRRGSK